MGDHSKHTPDKVRKVLAVLAKTDNIAETARITGVPMQTVFRWKIKYLHDPEVSLPNLGGASRDQIMLARQKCWAKFNQCWRRFENSLTKCRSPKEILQAQMMLWDFFCKTGLMLVQAEGAKVAGIKPKPGQARKASDGTLKILERHPSGEDTDPKEVGLPDEKKLNTNGIVGTAAEQTPEALRGGRPPTTAPGAP